MRCRIVDAERFESGLADPYLVDTLESQVRAADLLVVTKVDLVDAATARRVRSGIAALAPDTPAIDVEDAREASTLLALGGRRPGGVAAIPDATLFDAHVVERRPLPVGIGRSQLEDVLAQLEPDVVRAKGVAELDDGSLLLVQVVGRRVDLSPLPTPEREQPTDLVVIRLPR